VKEKIARDLQDLLSYSKWRNFLKVIEKARESCKNANNPILDHFVDANKSIPVPKGGVRMDSSRGISSITVSSRCDYRYRKPSRNVK
jgi:hypothetical protein